LWGVSKFERRLIASTARYIVHLVSPKKRKRRCSTGRESQEGELSPRKRKNGVPVKRKGKGDYREKISAKGKEVLPR